MMLRSKDPVPTEYTGAAGAYVTAEDVKRWCMPKAIVHVGKLAYPPGNIALRLPKNIIGIDVDAHSGKPADKVLAEAERRWGPLPATWKTNARVGSPKSGIRLYRVPEGLAWPGGLNKIAASMETGGSGGIELIRWDHRYVMAPPSINPDANGAQYFWVAPDGAYMRLPWDDEWLAARRAGEPLLDADGAEIELPSPDECTEMPSGWIEGLTDGRTWAPGGAVGTDGELDDESLKAWIEERDSRPVGGRYAGGVCPAMDRTVSKHVLAIRKAGDDGGAHDAARDGAWAAIGDAAEGHYGVGQALTRMRSAFLEAVKQRRGSERKAAGEWKRIVRRGISKVVHEYLAKAENDGSGDGSGGGPGEDIEGNPFEQQDICSELATSAGPEDPMHGGPAPARKAAGNPFGYPRTDIGNAQRLKQRLGQDVLWCGALGGWHFWDEKAGVWRLDDEGIHVLAEMMEVVGDMSAEAERIKDLTKQADYRKFINKTAGIGQMKAAITGLKSLKGVNVEGTRFDASMHLLHCNNGTVELTPDGVAFRPTVRKDYFRLTTGVDYIPGANHELWDKFLDKFLPDPEIRAWAQKLAGYSLQGENPARVLIVCKGKTSTGKTTFAEALRTALGGYAGTFSLSLFRANQDERPRVDVLEALPRRLIMAEEVSSAWHLHADQVKRATGNGMWEARGMYGKGYISRVPAFTPWIATNNTPTIEGHDGALMRRLRNIPFLHQVSQADEDGLYKAKMRDPAVLEAILAWAVQGWDLWLQDEPLTDYPPQVATQLAELSDEISEFAEMVGQVFNRGPAESASAEALYEAYELWCIEQSTPEKDRLGKIKFGRRLTEMDFGRDKVWDAEKGKMVQIRLGISVKNSNISSDLNR